MKKKNLFTSLAVCTLMFACVVLPSGCGQSEQEPGEGESQIEESLRTVESPEETTESVTETETETESETETEAELLEPKERYLAQVSDTEQMILVIGDGSVYGAELYYYEKNADGWTQILETPAQIGENGFSSHTIEGDGTTPTGCFELGLAFGNCSDPGTALEWVDVNPYHYWVDDPDSDYYNLLIDSREVPDGWDSGEHLEEYVNSYAYAVNIEVNPECTKDSTSAIFLHCYGKNPYTLGCVAVEESRMIELLKMLRPGAMITIVKSEEELESFY